MKQRETKKDAQRNKTLLINAHPDAPALVPHSDDTFVAPVTHHPTVERPGGGREGGEGVIHQSVHHPLKPPLDLLHQNMGLLRSVCACV